MNRHSMYKVATRRHQSTSSGSNNSQQRKSLSASILQAIGIGVVNSGGTEARNVSLKSVTTTSKPLIAPSSTSSSTTNEKEKVKVEVPLFDKLREQFESKLQHRNSADTAWHSYSNLLDSMLDAANVSIVSHHFLFQSISSTTATDAQDLTRKAALLDKIVTKLGPRAHAEELAALANVFERRNDLAKLRALYLSSRQSHSGSLAVATSLLRTTLRQKDYAAAISLFKELQASSTAPLTNATYLPMLRYYLEQSNFETVSLLLDEMKTRGIVPSPAVHEVQMIALQRQGRDEAVLAVFDNIQSLLQHAIPSKHPIPAGLRSCYFLALASMDKLKLVDRVVDLYKNDLLLPRLLATADHESGIKNRILRIISQNPLHLDLAFEIFNKSLSNWKQHGTIPSAVTFQIMVSMCCRFVSTKPDSQLLDSAIALMNQMESEFKLKPTLVTYNALLYTLAKQAKSGHLSAAKRDWHLSLLQQKYKEMNLAFGTLPIQPILHHQIISAFILNDHLDPAFEFMKPLLSSTTRPFPYLPLLESFSNQTVTRHANNLHHVDQSRSLVHLAAGLVSRGGHIEYSPSLLSATSATSSASLQNMNHQYIDQTSDAIAHSIAALISIYSANQHVKRGMEKCNSLYTDYKIIQTAFVRRGGGESDLNVRKTLPTSVVVDAMAGAVAKSIVNQDGGVHEFVSLLESLRGVWKISVAGLVSVGKILTAGGLNQQQQLEGGRRKVEFGMFDALIEEVERKAGWEFRREVVCLKAIRESLEEVGEEKRERTRVLPAVGDLEWVEAGLTKEDVEGVHGFAIESGRRVTLF
ncbi:UNVERIFIED_CONTAM: hypothetical protein HDU68_008820 [Siphonaria sp. JEL0065]|nr:hypothetical protein HDU68_008820 [Siphonaria sp. JEL0065]